MASKECYHLVNGNHFWRGLCNRDLAPVEDIQKEEFFASLLRDDQGDVESEEAKAKIKRKKKKGKAKQTDTEAEEEPTKSEDKEEKKNAKQIKRLIGDIKWKDIYRYWLDRVLIIYIVYEAYQDIFDVRDKLSDAGLLVSTYRSLLVSHQLIFHFWSFVDLFYSRTFLLSALTMLVYKQT